MHGTQIIPSPAIPPTPNPECHKPLRMMLKARPCPWEGCFALKKSPRFCSLMQTPASISRRGSVSLSIPFSHLHPHFPTSPCSTIPGRIQVELGRQVPGSRCSREHQRAPKIHILTQHKAPVSPLMAHLPAAGPSSQAAK